MLPAREENNGKLSSEDSPEASQRKKQNELLKYQQRIEIANRIEKYLNEQMKYRKLRIFNYFEVAREIGVDEAIVGEILFAYDGRSNGITIWNHK